MLPGLLISCFTFFVSCNALLSYPGYNTPPVFDFKREWLIPENEPVGSRVCTVRTRDAESDSIVYSIEPAIYLDGSKYFTINPRTGDVFLKESLVEKSGNDLYLYVTANDGHQTAKIETYVRVVGTEDKSSGVVASAFDVHANRSSSMAGRPHSFPGFNFNPLSPQKPKNPYFAIATHQRPATTATTNTKPRVLPEAPNSASTDTTSQRYPDPVYQPTQQPDDTTTKESDNSTGRSDGSGDDIRGGGSTATIGRPATTPADRHSSRLDLITAFLPLLAAIAFAPLVAVVFFFLHRKWNQRKRQNLIKSVSQKMSANKTQSAETTISSELDYNGAYFQKVRPGYRAPSNRYEPDTVVVSPFVLPPKDGRQWEFPRHHLHFKDILGEGCFGQVWRCEATDICGVEGKEIVAVKTLKENASEKEKKDIVAEMEIMKMLDPHPNVVTLLGCCSDKEPVFLIMEFVPYGKLQSYLRDSRTGQNDLGLLTSQDLTSFAYQVAKGMEYISSKGIIHRDLAARNILIDSNKVCKIADFGFARDVIANHVYERKSEGRLPIRWMAPESLYDNVFTTKSDVWSFGILMWEIVTLGSTPYPGLGAAEVMKRVRDGFRLEKPEHCKREMYNIMFYCWDSRPDERPPFTETVQMLDKLLISENDYIELERFPDHSYYNIISNLSGEKL